MMDNRGLSSYYRMVRSLTGDLQEIMLDFLEWCYGEKDLQVVYKTLLGCHDPTTVNKLLGIYHDNNIDPSKSHYFKSRVRNFIPASVKENLKLRDTELGQKALIVGNVKNEEMPYEILEGG